MLLCWGLLNFFRKTFFNVFEFLYSLWWWGVIGKCELEKVHNWDQNYLAMIRNIFWFQNCQAGFEKLMTEWWQDNFIIGWWLYFANTRTLTNTDNPQIGTNQNILHSCSSQIFGELYCGDFCKPYFVFMLKEQYMLVNWRQ